MKPYNPKIDELVTIISKDSSERSTRLSLSQALGISDRECRDLRRQAFLNGYPVISCSDMAGSYMTDEKIEVLKFGKEAYKKAISELEIYHAAMRMYENWDQVKLKIDELV